MPFVSDLVLLDTHALFWLVGAERNLGRGARERAEAALADSRLWVSAFSFWEIAMLAQRRRIELYQPAMVWRQRVLESGVNEVPVSGDIAIMAAQLEHFHLDPADRIIAATAASQGATLLTADERLLSWQGPLKRHDARS